MNAQRLRMDFDQLAEIGATGDGGVHRPALGEADLQARLWLHQRMEAAGLQVHQDDAGNLSGFLRCGPEGGKTFLLGSHLDSVPHGGRFDGPLGVLAALEALRVVQENGLRLPCHLEAIDFSDEEGTLVGLLGSSALSGLFKPAVLQAPQGGRDVLLAGLARLGLMETRLLKARRDPESLAGYLELHIEQGPHLYESGFQIGVVTAIVGIASCQLHFRGRANHAGTTPMRSRRDAGLGASAFTLAARRVVLEQFPGCTANTGEMHFNPGAYNIVPGEVVVSFEYRAPDSATFDSLEAALLAQAKQEAQVYDLELEVVALGRHEPAPMHPAAQQAVRRAADLLGLSHIDLASGAGHDGQNLAALCPAGMVFIPSVAGISHSPQEFSRWEDCLNGANVLLQAALNFILKD